MPAGQSASLTLLDILQGGTVVGEQPQQPRGTCHQDALPHAKLMSTYRDEFQLPDRRLHMLTGLLMTTGGSMGLVQAHSCAMDAIFVQKQREYELTLSFAAGSEPSRQSYSLVRMYGMPVSS